MSSPSWRGAGPARSRSHHGRQRRPRPTIGPAPLILLIVFMFFGRVGIMTIGMGFLTASRAEERFEYAPAKLLIG